MATERSALLEDSPSERTSNLQASIEDSQDKSSQSRREGILGKILKVVRGPERLWSVIYASVVAVIGSLMFGYSLGYASPVLLELSDNNFVCNVSHAPFSNTGVYFALFGVSHSAHFSAPSVHAVVDAAVKVVSVRITSQYIDLCLLYTYASGYCQ